MKKLITVVCDLYEFKLQVYPSKNQSEQMIESEFYEQWSPSHKVPEGSHCEIEIIWIRSFEGIESSSYINISEKIKESGLHIHETKKPEYVGRFFVCWTGKLESYSEVKKLLEMWIPGTVYSLNFNKDFSKELSENAMEVTLENSQEIAEYFSECFRIEIDEDSGLSQLG